MNLLDDIRSHIEYSIANAQGNIFKYASELGYDLETFVEKYMESDFCNKDMDSEYSPFQNELDVPCMEILTKEFSNKKINIPINTNIKYEYCAYYIGFVYRYLQILSGLSSKEIYKKIPFKKMTLNYFLDHYEYSDAIKEICRCEKINYNKFV